MHTSRENIYTNLKPKAPVPLPGLFLKLLILDPLCERGGGMLLPTGCVALEIGCEGNMESYEKELTNIIP
jgi:hypothetical protein